MIEIREGRTFHLQTRNTSYLFSITDMGLAEHIYYGKRLPNPDIDLFSIREKHLSRLKGAVMARTRQSEADLSDMMLEFSSEGRGDFKKSLVAVTKEGGERTLDLRFIGYEIIGGIRPMEGFLPQAEAGASTETLTLAFQDKESDITLNLIYTVFEEADVVTRRSILKNSTKSEIHVTTLFSSQLDLREEKATLITFQGIPLSERTRSEERINVGTYELSKRRLTGEVNPAAILNTLHGSYFLNLVYSSEHKMKVSRSRQNLIHIVWGMNDDGLSWRLSPGESLESPEAIMIWAEDEERGSALSRAFIERQIRRGKWKSRVRPVMFDTWHAFGYELEEKEVHETIRRAKRIGLEGLILGDGWFASRSDSSTSLGDWWVNTERFPSGLQDLSARLHKEGMLFGLWIAPEAISEKSDLATRHPDWIVGRSLAESPESEGALLLDITRPEVREYLVTTISALIEREGIDWLTWETLRPITDVWSSSGGHDLGSFTHRWALGLYEILRKIGQRYPNLYIEGAGHFDLGMMVHTASIRSSKSGDVLDRLHVSEGTLSVYPLSIMGTCFAPSPDSATLRASLAETRFSVNSFGVLSYSINLNTLTETQLSLLKDEITFYKENRPLFQYGNFLYEEIGGVHIWTLSDWDSSNMIVMRLRERNRVNVPSERLFVESASDKATYLVHAREDYIQDEDRRAMEAEGYKISGTALRWAGIALADRYSGGTFKEGMRRVRDGEARLYIIRKDEKTR